MTRPRLHVVYIRPSRYDDDGYVLRYWRGVQCSNTLACLRSLTLSVAENELADLADVTVELLDDTVQRISVKRIARMKRGPTRVVVGLVGVQSNQFMRASDLALEIRKAGVQVMIGGFHVSGMMALFGEPPRDLQVLTGNGVSLVRGEAEAPGALAGILQDALLDQMKPVYNMLDFPDLENTPVPRMLGSLRKRFFGLPHDTPESVRRDIEVLRDEVRVDYASLFMMTPLPGSKDHWRMTQGLEPMDADYNNYDGLHETFKHPNMAPGEWRQAYHDAMSGLYSKEHIVNMLRRAPAGMRDHMFWVSFWYRYCTLEQTHPMSTGLYRLKDRKSRRPIFPRETVARYALRRLRDAAHGFRRYSGLVFDFAKIWMLTREPGDLRWKHLTKAWASRAHPMSQPTRADFE